MGYAIGALFLLLYAVMCFYVAIKKPENMIRIVKLKFGNKITDETAVKICYGAGIVAVIIAIVLLFLRQG